MDHDPLCPVQPEIVGGAATDSSVKVVQYEPSIPCQCTLIAKVRADERNQVFTHLDALADRDHAEGCPSLTCTGCADQ